MKVYPNLFAYLNGDYSVAETTVVHGCDRPIVTIDSDVNNSLLIKHNDNLYEIGFPYLKLSDSKQYDERHQAELQIETDNFKYSFFITDEVIDEEAIEDENKLKEWLKSHQEKYLDSSVNLLIENCQELFRNKNQLPELFSFDTASSLNDYIDLFIQNCNELFSDDNQFEEWLSDYQENILDTSVALLIQNFNNLFDNKDLGNSRQGKNIDLYFLPKHLANFDFSQASLPLVVSLETQYKLVSKLRTITPKLRHQLRRKAELMPIGRIQEMDSYCLRDYVRRPGKSPAEKAGAKQQLMGVRREQNYNTLENKFLVHFTGKLLHLECFRYEQSKAEEHEKIVKKLRQAIDSFIHSPLVENINCRHFKLGKPNYVLQQNPIYNSFYQAYQDYLKRRSEKQRLWSYRTNLLGDTIYLCLTAGLLRFQGVFLKPLANLKIRTNPDRGNYLEKDNSFVSIPVFLQDFVYEFRLDKSSDLTKGDYCLTIELHDLKSSDFTTKVKSFPIWIFWYKPSESIINSANRYINSNCNDHSLGILFYLQPSPNITRIFPEVEREMMTEKDLDNSDGDCNQYKNIWLCKIPNPLDSKNFTYLVDFLAQKILKPLAEVVR